MAWPLLYVARVNAVESTWRSRVRGITEQLADRLADGKDAKLRRQIRVLADDLMREMLRAVCAASASEIAQAISALEDTRAERAALQRSSAGARLNGRPHKTDFALALAADAALGRRAGQAHRERATDSRDADVSPPQSHAPNPFDITMPSELLASTDDAKPARSDDARAAAAASTPSTEGEPRVPPRVLSASDGSSRTAAADEAEAASERRPKVMLREGERLLKGTGSGVVIRRERRVKP